MAMAWTTPPGDRRAVDNAVRKLNREHPGLAQATSRAAAALEAAQKEIVRLNHALAECQTKLLEARSALAEWETFGSRT